MRFATKKGYNTKLEWTNYDEWKEYIENLKKIYGNKIPVDLAMSFRFEFNHGQVYTSNESI